MKPIQQSFAQAQMTVSDDVYLKAYEVYCEVCGPQPAMIEGTCRGGFSVGELVALLYAGCASQDEWRQRFLSAIREVSL